MNAKGLWDSLQPSCEPAVICAVTGCGLVVPGGGERDEEALVRVNMAWSVAAGLLAALQSCQNSPNCP